MPKLKLIGSFEDAKSGDASMGRAVNMYPERNPLTGKIAFYPTPGSRVWKDTAAGTTTGCVALYPFNGAMYAVINSKLLHISSAGILNTLGTLSGTWDNIRDVSITDNGPNAPGQQLLIVSGHISDPAAYIRGGGILTRIDRWRGGVTSSASSNKLVDAGALFSSDSDIVVGTKVVNTSTGDEAYVTIIAADDLTLDTDIFGSGDPYDIGDDDFPHATSVEFFDGYFIATNDNASRNQGRFYWSSSYEGIDWAALDYATAERIPDRLEAVKAVGRDLYLLGRLSTEIWYNSGTAINPFKPKYVLPVGYFSDGTIQKIGDGIIMVGRVRYGDSSSNITSEKDNQVIMLQGTKYQVISTPKLDRLLSDPRYVTGERSSNVYSVDGHLFYRLYLSTVRTQDNKANGRTFLYDITESTWVEEEIEHSTDGDFRGNMLQMHTHFSAKFNNGTDSVPTSSIIAGSISSDVLYEIDPNAMGHFGLVTDEEIAQSIRREIISGPVVDKDDHVLRHKRVVIEVTTGHKAAAIRGIATSTSANNLVCAYMHFTDDSIIDNTMTVHNITDGTSAGISTVTNNGKLALDTDIFVEGDEFTVDIGTDPDITLEWTDDGGATWKGPITRTLGAAGDEETKIVFSNLGVARERVYRIRCPHLAHYVITDAHVYVALHKRYS